jgi:hypothetical protein
MIICVQTNARLEQSEKSRIVSNRFIKIKTRKTQLELRQIAEDFSTHGARGWRRGGRKRGAPSANPCFRRCGDSKEHDDDLAWSGSSAQLSPSAEGAAAPAAPTHPY